MAASSEDEDDYCRASASDDEDDFCIELERNGDIPNTDREHLKSSFRSWENLCDFPDTVLRSLKASCSLAGFPMTTDTFWLPAEADPQNVIESFVQAVFQLHTRGVRFERDKSGAEWWAQVRRANDDGTPDTLGFHWDKDERLHSELGIFVISTVTYLTDNGGPTVILDSEVSSDGTLRSHTVTHGYISFPEIGKHVSFDGRLLHAALGQLAQTQPSPGNPRVTLLVNIWLGHRPVGKKRCPAAISQQIGNEPGPHSWLRPDALETAGKEFQVSAGTAQACVFDLEQCAVDQDLTLSLPVEALRAAGGSLSVSFGHTVEGRIHERA